MRLKTLILALAASILIASVADAASITPRPALRSVNARNYEIAGVKIGMGWEQALAAAAKHFHVSSDEFNTASDKTAFMYKKGDSNLAVYFVQQESARPPMVAYISYTD